MLNANVAFANGANHIGEVRTVSVRELAGVAGFIFGMAVSVAFATGLAQLLSLIHISSFPSAPAYCRSRRSGTALPAWKPGIHSPGGAYSR